MCVKLVIKYNLPISTVSRTYILTFFAFRLLLSINLGYLLFLPSISFSEETFLTNLCDL